MKIAKLFIKNFRSIGSEGMEIIFNSNITTLIGANNVGKSNILRAIDLVIGDEWPKDTFFELEDFHQKNIENDIEISVYFDAPIEYKSKIDWYEYPSKIYGFKLEYKTYKRKCENGDKGELHLQYSCINKDGAIILIPSAPPKKGEKLKFSKTLYVNKAIRSLCDLTVFISVDRDVLSHSPSQYRSLLRHLIEDEKGSFIEAGNLITIDPEMMKAFNLPKELTRKQLFDTLMDKANEVLKTENINKISELIGKYLMEHVGQIRSGDVKFDFQLQDGQKQYKNITLNVKHNDLLLPAERLGHGFQSLAVIAIFRAYLELNGKNAIFLIEEPEMFLHTHAKKYFYSILNAIAEKGTQIIITTHATEFVDILNYKNIKRIVKEDNGTMAYPKDVVELDFSQDEMLKLNTAINNERAELYFADMVMLVEGETEKVVYDYLFRMIGIDTNLTNISIIETSGKGSIHRYIGLLESISVPFVAIVDSDILENTGEAEKDSKIAQNNKDAKSKNDVIRNSITDKKRLFVFEPYFEYVAGMATDKQNKKDSKPIKALEYFRSMKTAKEIKDKCPSIIEPIESILGKKY